MSLGWGPGYGDPMHPTTGELPRVGDGVRGTGEMQTVQIDTVKDLHVTPDVRTDTTQLPALRGPIVPDFAAAPKQEQQTGQVSAAPTQPVAEPAPNLPVRRQQLGPDWTHMPLRLLAATVVAMGVLGASAASLWYVAEWINP